MLNYTWLYRMVWICGRFGGGKTSLGIAIALWLCRRSYARYIASNIELTVGKQVACVSANELRRVSCEGPVYRDTVILMDEAWIQLGKGSGRKQVVDWLAYIRKGNNFLVMPSVMPLVAEVGILRVERIFNGMTVGIPGWLYRWNLGDKRKGGDTGVYWFNDPKSVFGLYDTIKIPSEDYRIYDTWQAKGSEEDSGFDSGFEDSSVLVDSLNGGGGGGDLGGELHSIYTSGKVEYE